MKGHKTFESAKANLVRLAYHLADAQSVYVKDLMTARRAATSQAMRWHDKLRHDLAVAHSETSVSGQRTSREQAWRFLEGDTGGGTNPDCLMLDGGDVIAINVDEEWQAGIVLTLWRGAKNGQVQAVGPLPRGSLKHLRAAVLSSPEPGVLVADQSSRFVILPVEPD